MQTSRTIALVAFLFSLCAEANSPRFALGTCKDKVAYLKGESLLHDLAVKSLVAKSDSDLLDVSFAHADAWDSDRLFTASFSLAGLRYQFYQHGAVEVANFFGLSHSDQSKLSYDALAGTVQWSIQDEELRKQLDKIIKWYATRSRWMDGYSAKKAGGPPYGLTVDCTEQKKKPDETKCYLEFDVVSTDVPKIRECLE